MKREPRARAALIEGLRAPDSKAVRARRLRRGIADPYHDRTV